MDSWLNTHYFSCGLYFQFLDQNTYVGSYLASQMQQWGKVQEVIKKAREATQTENQSKHVEPKSPSDNRIWRIVCILKLSVAIYPQQFSFIWFWNLIDTLILTKA